jgi:UDP-N-acetylglucosamine pyrophosphorylase
MKALKEQGHLQKMKDTGVKWIASYIIDNILARVCDPLLLGFGIENEYSSLSC